jgi:hypothetical protein
MIGPSDVSEITLFETFEDMQEHLQGLNPETNSDILALHGTITKANTLPAQLHQLQAFIVLINPYKTDGIIIESQAMGKHINTLAFEIENILNTQHDSFPWLDIPLEINDIFILYGYEMDIGMSVNEDDIDEDIVEKSQKIVLELEAIKERYNRSLLG